MTAVDEPVAVRSSAAWPVFDGEIARAEIVAMELLFSGVSAMRVRRCTGLSDYRVRWLVTLMAEEADDLPRPRNVCRQPRRPRAAAIRLVRNAAPPVTPSTQERDPLTLF
ncbi:hypothetical protein [Streptomyces triculaminicus]|uniref:hypothetical protein n=1 Tax=Streptomyces triculaminicus TaxID=2816232 RepID=UPI0037D535CA